MKKCGIFHTFETDTPYYIVSVENLKKNMV